MNSALWTLQGLLAIAMFGAGTFKLTTPHAKLSEKMKWPATWPPARVKLLGLAQILGAIGLVVPWATGILPVLTPVAGCCLLLIMLGAVNTHVDLDEPIIAPAVLSAIALIIALGRFWFLDRR